MSISSVSARARAILDETNATRGLVDGFGRVCGSNDHPILRGVVLPLHPSWRQSLRVNAPLDVGDEDAIHGHHELDQDGKSKALVNGHIAYCCAAHKVAGNAGDREEHLPVGPY